MNRPPPPCPLCHAPQPIALALLRRKRYWRCIVCYLAFLDAQHHLPPAAERAEYSQHRNDPADLGYRRFLRRLTDHLTPHLASGAAGLDYGAGPGPTLSVMLQEQGFAMHIYDPYFAPDATALARTYDFITCTETVEHFYQPRREFNRLQRLLRPGGWLGVMTETMISDARFPHWWYHSDPTHVCFYRHETLTWIAQHYGWHLETPRKNVALFHKRSER